MTAKPFRTLLHKHKIPLVCVILPRQRLYTLVVPTFFHPPMLMTSPAKTSSYWLHLKYVHRLWHVKRFALTS